MYHVTVMWREAIWCSQLPKDRPSCWYMHMCIGSCNSEKVSFSIFFIEHCTKILYCKAGWFGHDQFLLDELTTTPILLSKHSCCYNIVIATGNDLHSLVSFPMHHCSWSLVTWRRIPGSMTFHSSESRNKLCDVCDYYVINPGNQLPSNNQTYIKLSGLGSGLGMGLWYVGMILRLRLLMCEKELLHISLLL